MAEARNLLDYSGSETENVMKIWIRRLVSDTTVPECFNLVIKPKACNGMVPGPFNNACVILQLHADMMVKPTDDRPSSHATALCFDQLFNIEILKTISKEEFSLSNLKTSSLLATVLLPLLDFLNDIEKHKNAVRRCIDVLTEGSMVTAVLAEHLFSRLVPHHRYVLDGRCKTLPKECPCANCKAPVKTGCTAIGSSTTWHGYADAFLNKTVALSVYKQCLANNSDCETDLLKESLECIDEQNSQLCTEVKGHKPHSEILYDLNIMNQLVAEAITNGFAQVNVNDSLTGCFVPTFGCTPEAVCVYLYDPVNDILLQNCQLIKLWQIDGSFDITAIMKIWLYLNFAVLGVRDISKIYKLLKSGFHTCDEGVLKRYQEAKCKLAIGPSEDNFQCSMGSLLEMCQRATLQNSESSRFSSMA